MYLCRIFMSLLLLLVVCHLITAFAQIEKLCLSKQSSGSNEFEHPCLRPCAERSSPMECHYNFQIEVYHILSLACFNCPVNVADCYRPDCIAADGTDKSVLVANRKLPGPSIQVCKNDIIVVDVENDANPQTTSIHWHGILQRNHQFMDGLPMVTQCPIQPMTTFRYKFPVPDAGTYLWHSHSILQQGNGLFGGLIIRQEKDQKAFKYDYDLAEHVIIVSDWYNVSTVEKFTKMEFYELIPDVQSMLVNGRGRYRNITLPDGRKYQTPLSEFYVQQGKRYRFRLIGAGVECGIQVSIDGHRMEIIATDGRPVVPTVVDAVNIFTGERYDFILNANNSVANYWMKFRGLDTCHSTEIENYQMAILRYTGTSTEDPTATPSYNYTRAKGFILNPDSSDNQTMIGTVTMLTSTLPDDATVLRTPDVKITIRFDYRNINDTTYNRAIYAHNMSLDLFHVKTVFPMINYIFNHEPPSPLLSEYNLVPESQLCDAKSLKKQGRDCTVDFCKCTHVIKLPLKAVVQLLLVDDGVHFSTNDVHPMHLHGHSFRVVAIGRFPSNRTKTVEAATKEVEHLEQLVNDNQIAQKLKGAVYKDTINVPDGGYAVVRFYTDNPGFWFLHCHIEHHIALGMSLIFQVGNQKHFPKPPPHFPKCGNFLSQKRKINI